MFPAASFTSMAPTSYKNVSPTLKNFNLIVCIEDLLVLWFMYFPYCCSCTLPSGHMTLKIRQVLVEFWSLRHLTLRQCHSDVRFITSYMRPIRYIISTLYSDIVSTNHFTTSC